MKKKILALILACTFGLSTVLTGCSADTELKSSSAAVTSDKDYIEETLNLANNEEQEWT